MRHGSRQRRRERCGARRAPRAGPPAGRRTPCAHTARILVCALLASVARGQASPEPAWYPPTGAEITRLLLHYDSAVEDALAPAWRDLLPALGREVAVSIAVARAHDVARARALAAGCGVDARHLDVLCVGRQLSLWPRDAAFALGGPVEVFVGLRGRGGAARLADLAAVRLAAARLPAAVVVTAPIDLDGGQVVFGRRRVFVGGRGVGATPDHGLAPVRQWLPGTIQFVRAPLGAPHPHLDMYFAALDDERVLLGDPGADGASGARCEAIAEELRRDGLLVARIPLVDLGGGRVLSWTNALTESRGGRPVAYVPAYGTPLDGAAQAAWRAQGFCVLPIDCRRLAAWGGAVRCLTSVLAWRSAARTADEPHAVAFE